MGGYKLAFYFRATALADFFHASDARFHIKLDSDYLRTLGIREKSLFTTEGCK